MWTRGRVQFDRIMILDGALGTMLQQAGLKPGECPELLNLERPEIVSQIHRAYKAAGSDIIHINSFGANRFKLESYGLASRVAEINRAAVALAREAVGGNVMVAADIGPTGRMSRPFGDLEFDQFYEVFAEQVRAVAAAGADLISIETMSDLVELRAAVIAAREHSSVPIMAQVTFGKGDRTMMGTDPVTVAVVLDALGVDVIGANCSGGPAQLLEVIRQMRTATDRPLVVQPNAGLPVMTNGQTVYAETPAGMAAYVPDLVRAGAAIIGGCCGTTPEHIKAIKTAAAGLKPVVGEPRSLKALAGRTRTVALGRDEVFLEMPEPARRPDLAEAIRAGRMEAYFAEAERIASRGAAVIGVNVELPGADQVLAMTEAIAQVQAATDRPVAISSSVPAAAEAGLKAFQGKALLAGRGMPGRTEFLTLARQYGAAVLLSIGDEQGISDTAAGKVNAAERVVANALKQGINRADICLDCTAGAGRGLGEIGETLQAAAMIRKELGVVVALRLAGLSREREQPEPPDSSILGLIRAQGVDLPIYDEAGVPAGEIRTVIAALAGRSAS